MNARLRIGFVTTTLFLLLASSISVSAATASLSGKVEYGNGAPVDGALVTIWNASGGFVDQTITGLDGSWSADGLANGSYKIRAGDFGDDHDWTYYGGASWTSATAVSFTGSTVTGLDIAVPEFEAVKRLAGADRYRTAVAVSEDVLLYPSDTVYVASGLDFPDALAGGPGAIPGSPILLVHPDFVPAGVAPEIQRLDPTEIVILGGTGAVSAAVEAALTAYAPVRRLAGADRFATAAAISAEAYSTAATVYLANGLNFPDALAGGAAAGHLLAPVLLTTDSTLPSPTRTELIRLKPTEIVVLGGTGAVSDDVLDAAQAAVPGAAVRRVAGPDRFATAAEISEDTFVLSPDTVFVANGLGFPDALAGAPAAIWSDAPLLLVTTDTVPTATRKELERIGPSQIVILGGTAVVSDAVAAQLETYITP